MNIYKSDGRSTRNKGFWRFKIYIFIILGCGLVVLGIYIIFLSPLMKVQVEVVGNQRINSEELLAAIQNQLLNKTIPKLLGINNYLSWIGKVKLDEPLLAKLTVDKMLWQKKVRLIIEERQPFGVWCHDSANLQHACYWFDKTGALFENAPAPEGHLILRIDSDAAATPVIGQPTVNQEWYQVILRIIGFFEKNNLAVKKYEFKEPLQEFHALSLAGASVNFSLRFDPANSLAGLATFLEKNSLKGLQYIDLTVENRMYVKSR